MLHPSINGWRTALILGFAWWAAACAGSPGGPSQLPPVAPVQGLPVTGTAPPLAAPGAPTNLSGVVTATLVALRWTAPIGGDPPTSYVVEAGSFPGGSNLAIYDTGALFGGQNFPGVPPGTYYIRVRAKNAAGLSPPSNEIILVVQPGNCTSPPGAPTGLGYTVRGATITLMWTTVTGATTYVLEAGSSAGLSNLASFDTANTTGTYTAFNVPPGDYYVRVRARNACGLSPPSNEVVPRVCPSGLPSCPGATDNTPIGDSRQRQ